LKAEKVFILRKALKKTRKNIPIFHWLADSNFPAQFTGKNVVWFLDIFAEKNGEIFKAFLPLFNFLLSFSLQTRKVVIFFWVFHLGSG
jgi:hypothetical protein